MSPPKNRAASPAAHRVPAGVMMVADVAALWGVTPSTVWSYRKESRDLVGNRKGRYADNPMPEPAGYMSASKKGPWWREDQRQALADWFQSRPGRAHGTGGRRAGSKKVA